MDLRLNSDIVQFTDDGELVHLQRLLMGMREASHTEVGIVVRGIAAHISGVQSFGLYVAEQARLAGLDGMPECEELWEEVKA